MVKYIRNNYLLPEVQFKDLDKLNGEVLTWCTKDRERSHYEKGELISELHLAGKQRFLQLPGKLFEYVRYEQLKADKYGLIRIDGKQYSTSPRFAGLKVMAKVSYNKVSILTKFQRLTVKALLTNCRIE